MFVQRLDGHMGVANSLAMKLANVDRSAVAPEGGAIVRDEKGEPTGVFKDNAMPLITRAVPEPTVDDIVKKAQAALNHAVSLGVTTIQDMTASATELNAYAQLASDGKLPARIYSIRNYAFDGKGPGGVLHPDWLRANAIKLFADGAMGSGTAAFFEPYADDPKTSGLLLQSPQALEKAMFDADAAGFQLIVHAIGDKANAIVLDAFEKLQRERGVRDRRGRIEHAQVVRAEDKKRFKAANVIASIQPSHCIDDMPGGGADLERPRKVLQLQVVRGRRRPDCPAPTGMSSRSIRCSASTPRSPGS